jgi:hypothetical protein
MLVNALANDIIVSHLGRGCHLHGGLLLCSMTQPNQWQSPPEDTTSVSACNVEGDLQQQTW